MILDIVDRDAYKFRGKARKVAIADLMLSSMSLCLCLIFFVGLMRIAALEDHELLNAREKKLLIELEMDAPLTAPIERNSGGIDIAETPKTTTHFGKSGDFQRDGFVKMMWTLLALICIMTGVQILAAIRLLNATQLGKDPIGAQKLCRFWRVVCIFFTGLLLFNFLSAFRQRGENFFEVTFLLSSIIIRIFAIYIVQQFMNELDDAIINTLPIHRIHHPISANLMNNTFGGDNMAYGFGGQQETTSAAMAPPPKYEDVVKQPYMHFEATKKVDEA